MGKLRFFFVISALINNFNFVFSKKKISLHSARFWTSEDFTKIKKNIFYFKNNKTNLMQDTKRVRKSN